MSVQIDEGLCVGCGCCMDACEFGALEFKENEDITWVNEEECTECESCIEMCPNLAISLEEE